MTSRVVTSEYAWETRFLESANWDIKQIERKCYAGHN